MPTGSIIPAAFIALIASAVLLATSAKEHRSREVTREFQREQPCPSTGARGGRCPGYIRDHIVLLACHGLDAVANMQWQTVAAGQGEGSLGAHNMRAAL